MARIRIRNVTHGPITLPAPYNTFLREGGSIIVTASSKASVTTTLGGSSVIAGILEVSQVPDGSS